MKQRTFNFSDAKLFIFKQGKASKRSSDPTTSMITTTTHTTGRALRKP
ncbi:hypothetical protein [Pedobacter sp. SYP-B3415]|nr:hypothetical protein [Pedobacter sp. SYP-B3415]